MYPATGRIPGDPPDRSILIAAGAVTFQSDWACEVHFLPKVRKMLAWPRRRGSPARPWLGSGHMISSSLVAWIDERSAQWRVVVQGEQRSVPGRGLKPPAHVAWYHDGHPIHGVEVLGDPSPERRRSDAQIHHHERHPAGHARQDARARVAEQRPDVPRACRCTSCPPSGTSRRAGHHAEHRRGTSRTASPPSSAGWPGRLLRMASCSTFTVGRLAQAAARRRTKAGQDDRRGMVSAGSRRSRGRHPRGEGRALTGGEGSPASRLYRVAHRVGPIAAVVAGPCLGAPLVDSDPPPIPGRRC